MRRALADLATASVLPLLAGTALLAFARPPAATPAAPAPHGRVVGDARSGRVVLDGPPRRAAVLFPPTVDDYLLVTQRPQGLAVAQRFNRAPLLTGVLGRLFPPARRTRFLGQGGPDGGVGLETLLKADPDVVFASTTAAPAFRRVGLPTLAYANPGDLRFAEDRTRLFAQANAEPGRLAELETGYHGRMADLARAVGAPAAASRPRVLILYDYQGRLTAFGPKALPVRLMAAAGGVDAVGGGPVVALDRERLLRVDPDVILTMNTSPPSLQPADLMADPAWAPLRAVRTRRVYRIPPAAEMFPDGLLGYPLFVRWVAELLHPSWPSRLRADMCSTYASASGHVLNEADLDTAVALQSNASSTGYERFARP